jgi:hypothetical protein
MLVLRVQEAELTKSGGCATSKKPKGCCRAGAPRRRAKNRALKLRLQSGAIWIG